jgi:hypothetical protein
VRLSHLRPDGTTLRQHLQAAANDTGRADPRLASRVPAEAAALWDAFVSMSGSRQGGAAIAPSEIVAWQQLHGVRLSSWEVDTIARIDRAALAAHAELVNTERKA